jgi:hypothetical protein
MRSNPAEEWQRLTSLYAEKSDEELLELGADFKDLTEFAQPNLRDEMKKRGLGEPTAPTAKRSQPQPPPEHADTAGESELVEYSWMVMLCRCDTTEQANQLQDALYRGGVDAWIQNEKSPGRHGLRYSELLVAPDQLDEARRIAAQPLPQDILDAANAPPLEDFVPPACPKCHSENSLLEGSEPTNSWRCDDCGYEWSEAASGDDNATQT